MELPNDCRVCKVVKAPADVIVAGTNVSILFVVTIEPKPTEMLPQVLAAQFSPKSSTEFKLLTDDEEVKTNPDDASNVMV